MATSNGEPDTTLARDMDVVDDRESFSFPLFSLSLLIHSPNPPHVRSMCLLRFISFPSLSSVVVFLSHLTPSSFITFACILVSLFGK